jgi:hypothetical protein
MSRSIYSLFLSGLVLAGIITTGCGPEQLDTARVEGVVTLDGEPVPEAEVTFVPVTDGEGMSAVGRTDERGRYRLTAVGTGAESAAAGAGTLPGTYYVGVRKVVIDSALSPDLAERMDEYEPPTGRDDPQPTHIVPQRYNNPRQSGLQKTVEQGENNIPLELTTN